MNYAYWKAALAGEKPKMFVDDPQPGFYRSGVYEKQENKARKRVGWKPVAIFLNDGELIAAIGADGMLTGNGAVARMETDRDRINELWSYCAANAISEEWYRAVADRGEQWPDSHEQPPSAPINDAPMGNAERISRGLAECKEYLPKYAIIDSDEMSSKARSLQNRFLDLRGEAGKHYEAANRPLLDAQKMLRELWFPMRDQADEAANTLRTAMGAWEDEKRKAAKLAQEAAEKVAREHAEATRKAEQANQPAPPPPEPAKSNVPPPAAQIRGGAGRAASVSVAVFVTAIDEDKVFAQFKGNPELTALLTALAQKAIRAGIAVPGATTEERSVVR